MENPVSKQCRLWSDATLCVTPLYVASDLGLHFFAYDPFMGLQVRMGWKKLPSIEALLYANTCLFFQSHFIAYLLHLKKFFW